MTRAEAFLNGMRERGALVNLAALRAWSNDGERGRNYEVRDGAALIAVLGPLGNSWYCQTSYEDLQAEIASALADPRVQSIVLVVDSPGGYTAGAFECASAIAAAGKVKPVASVVTGVAYSGGYLMASQAEKIYLANEVTGGVGSIGVYVGHTDYSGALEQAGIKVTLLSAGEGKTDANPYEPLSETAKANAQAEVDRLYGEFVGAVARGRGMKPEAVQGLGAALFNGGAAAQAAGLVDAVGDLGLAITALRSADGFAARAAEKRGEQMEKAEIDKLVSEARAAGFGDAQEVVELCEVAGRRDLIAGFVGQKKSAADVRKDLLAARAAAAGGELNTGSMPGDDAKGADKSGKGQGKASAWGDVLAKAGIRSMKKEAQ